MSLMWEFPEQNPWNPLAPDPKKKNVGENDFKIRDIVILKRTKHFSSQKNICSHFFLPLMTHCNATMGGLGLHPYLHSAHTDSTTSKLPSQQVNHQTARKLQTPRCTGASFWHGFKERIKTLLLHQFHFSVGNQTTPPPPTPTTTTARPISLESKHP